MGGGSQRRIITDQEQTPHGGRVDSVVLMVIGLGIYRRLSVAVEQHRGTRSKSAKSGN